MDASNESFNDSFVVGSIASQWWDVQKGEDGEGDDGDNAEEEPQWEIKSRVTSIGPNP